MVPIVLLLWCILFLSEIKAYTVQGRFGHSAVQVNDSLYFYGGDSSVSSSLNQSEWISDLAILPLYIHYQLTDPPWKPASGPQNSVGGPSVFSHVAFMGGVNNGNMIVIGGVMPQTDKFSSDEEPTAYSYDCDLGRWNSFSLPSGNHLNRQGAACTTTEHGIAYIWGGKRATLTPPPVTINTTRPVLSASIYRFDSVYPVNSTNIVSEDNIYPPLRYAHTQTLIAGHKIVVLGGFDSATGDAVSLADVWIFDILTSKWNQIYAKLDKENKPANRSSHSQLLMPDGFSILVYGGYDGYHVYNDVAVLDTRTWTWNVKNTNAAVQGRADHTATLVNTNMIVAFGFTGVSTALTVMSDIEVLDITTWSWTSVYTPSGSNTGVNGIGGKENGIGGHRVGNNAPSSPSISIVAGAVTGGLVVFILILVAFYFLNSHHHKNRRNNKSDDFSTSTSSNLSLPQAIHRISVTNQHEMIGIRFKDRPSSTEPFEYCNDQSRRPSAQIPHPLQINTSELPTRSDTINTSTTIVTNSSSSIILLPSPWSKAKSKEDDTKINESQNDLSPSSSSTTTTTRTSDWMIRRAASTPTHHPIQNLNISKPDDIFYPNTTIEQNNNSNNNLRRAATVSELSNSKSSISLSTNNSSTATITNKNVSREILGNTIHNNTIPILNTTVVTMESNIINNDNNTDTNTKTNNNNNDNNNDNIDDDGGFDRQEFILTSDEVAKIDM